MHRKHLFIDVKKLKSCIDVKAFYEHELVVHLRAHSAKSWSIAGLCPFHADKRSGSFYVNLYTGAYKCFSCGVGGGDIIAFVQKKNELSFREALEQITTNWRVA